MQFNSQAERHDFIMDNEKLVYSRVLRLNHNIQDDDLAQSGFIGLIRAVDDFDPAKGYKFSTYAVSMIDGYIRRFKASDSLITYHKQPIQGIMSLDAPVAEYPDLTVGDSIPDPKSLEEPVDISHFQKSLEPIHQDILDLMLEDKTQKVIGKTLNIHRQTINRHVGIIRREYRKYLEVTA